MIDRPITAASSATASRGRPRTSAGRSLWIDALIFIIPCLLFLEVKLIGRLFGSEILLIAVLPILLLFQGRLLAAPMPRTVLLLGLLWLSALVATDLYRDTPFADYSRGWSKITFLMINFAALYMLLANNRRRLVVFAMGMVAGGLFKHAVSPDIFAQTGSGAWKFGLAVPITMLLVLGAQRGFERNTPRVVALFLFFAAGLNLIQDFRSLAGICFVTAIFLFIQTRQSRPGGRLSRTRLAVIAVIGVIGAVGFLEFYGFAARDGLLGVKAQQKYEIQASSKYGVLLGGRREVLIAIQAIIDSPFIGHGSWAKNVEYANMLQEMSGLTVLQRAMVRAVNPGLGIIPSHSHLFGAWVEAGVLGGLFWAYVLWLTARVLLYLSQMREVLTPLIAFIAFNLLWDIVFSPFGGERRLLMPYFIIVMMFAWNVIIATRHAQTAGPAPP